MPEKLRDIFFSNDFIEQLAEAIRQVFPPFDTDRFTGLVYDDAWQRRKLKEKMRHVTRCLHATLPRDYRQALDILEQVAPAFNAFDALVFPDYVACYGLDDWKRSLPALARFTPLCSSEFAIRPFLAADPARALPYLRAWADAEDSHLRRLASEGCRPRLPWGEALPTFKKDPGPILPILEKLKNDPSDYVRRSVANNLNDISKDHPELVLDICERWYGQTDHTDWIVKHACRGLLKAGNRRALQLFGFEDPTHLHLAALTLDRQAVSIGQAIRFSFGLHVDTPAACRVRLEYGLDYVKASGKLSRKIFQIREGTFAPGHHEISRNHSFADRSTRKHYPGMHYLAIIVNGEEKAAASVEVNRTDSG